jgi:hypothetical protein
MCTGRGGTVEIGHGRGIAIGSNHPLPGTKFAEVERLGPSARQAAQKLALVHAVLEGFVSIDENDGDLVVELAAKLGIRVHIDFLPGEPSTASEFCETLFHQLAEMTTFTRVDHDLPEELHG